MEDTKMDFSAGRNLRGCKKVRSVSMVAKSKLVEVFSAHLYDLGYRGRKCFVKQYVKCWQ